MFRSPYDLNLWNSANVGCSKRCSSLIRGLCERDFKASRAGKQRHPRAARRESALSFLSLSLSRTDESIFRSNIDSAIVCAVCRESERARERVRPVSRAVRRRCSFKKVECSPSARASEINYCLPRREREGKSRENRESAV